MSYIQNNLQSGENIIIKAKVNPMAIMGRFIWAVICIVGAIIIFSKKQAWLDSILEHSLKTSLGSAVSVMSAMPTYEKLMTAAAVILLIIGILPLLLGIIRLLFTEIAVTNKRVIGKVGIIRIKSTDLHIDKVDNIMMSATFWGRIFKFYTLNIKGSGDGEGIPYKGITNANEVKNTINTAIERHAEEARRAQAVEIANAMAGKK